MSLIDKIRKARHVTVESGGYAFTCRRPTDLEAMHLGQAKAEDLLDYVVGWKGVKEIDLVPGGTSIEVPFDAALCREWLADRPDMWGPIAQAVIEAYNRHAAELEERTKN